MKNSFFKIFHKTFYNRKIINSRLHKEEKQIYSFFTSKAYTNIFTSKNILYRMYKYVRVYIEFETRMIFMRMNTFS